MSPDSTRHIETVIAKMRCFLSANRMPILVLALLLFFGGLAYSIGSLEIGLSDIRWLPMVILLCAISPLGLVNGAANMMVMGKGANSEISARDAWRISCFAQLAEFLPLPGGALVRGSGMVTHGAKFGDAASHLIANALLWVGLSAIVAGIALEGTSLLGPTLILIGSVGAIICMSWIWRNASIRLALAALLVRGLGLILTGLRLKFAFATIDLSVSFLSVYPFAFAAIVGSASSITPGGLGISEALASTMATATTTLPAAAFLAVGLNRIVGLVVSGVASAILYFRKSV